MKRRNIHHADLIEEKALRLLNTPKAIVPSPTLNLLDNERKKYLVANQLNTNYTVAVLKSTSVKCSCKDFRWLHLCSHSVAVTEKEGILPALIAGVKSAGRSTLTYPAKAGGAGRMGGIARI